MCVLLVLNRTFWFASAAHQVILFQPNELDMSRKGTKTGTISYLFTDQKIWPSGQA